MNQRQIMGRNSKKYWRLIGALCISATLPMLASATVGGGQRIEILGYDKVEQKAFVLRHYDDARGRLPQLYYYDFTAKNPEKLVEVRSLYLDPKTKKYDEYDDQDNHFSSGINRIKKRLVPLTPDYTSVTLTVESLQQKKTSVNSWLGELGEAMQYQFKYRLITDEAKYSSASQTATTYSVCLTTDSRVYKIPSQPYALSTVKYKGTLMEGGYEYEDVVLLKQNK